MFSVHPGREVDADGQPLPSAYYVLSSMGFECMASFRLWTNRVDWVQFSPHSVGKEMAWEGSVREMLNTFPKVLPLKSDEAGVSHPPEFWFQVFALRACVCPSSRETTILV